MNRDEIEQKAREAYDASADEGIAHVPWSDLPAPVQNVWRDLAQGDAGAAVD